MGLPLTAVRLIAPLLANRSVLCFGNPDLLLSPETAKQEFGVDVPGWDGGKAYGLPHRLVQTRALFKALGATMYAVDLFPSGDVDISGCDLNEPHPEFASLFDMVIDPGTMEHCANVGQALMTAASAVRQDGYVLHVCPLTMFNHGFYNMCPTLLHDFYGQNGWVVKYLGAFNGAAPYDDVVWNPQWNHGRVAIPNNLAMLCLVQRRRASVLHWPTQKRWT